jgi:hypothetical protein
MTDDAIREDVSQDDIPVAEHSQNVADASTTEATEEQTVELTERELRMQEIVSQHNQENLPDAPASDEDFTPAERESDPLEKLGYYRNDGGDLVTRLKINGQEREVTADQMKAYAQKDIVADQRMQQAAEWERRLKEKESMLEQRNRDLQKTLNQPSAQDVGDLKQAAKAVLSKVYDGDEESAAEELAKLLSARQQPSVTPDAISQVVEQTLSQKEQEKDQIEWSRSTDEGRDYFKENHQDIYSDPVLFKAANERTAEMVRLRQQGHPDFITKTPAEMIKLAAREVQEWYDERVGGKEAPTSSSRSENKSKLSRMPQKGNKAHTPSESTVDYSPAAVIARQRDSRATSF